MTVVDDRELPSPAESPGQREAQRPGPREPSRRASKRPLTADEEKIALVSSVLIMVAIVCIWMAAQLIFLGALSQDRAQTLLHQEFRTQLASAVAPVGSSDPLDASGQELLEPGAPVALLMAPRIHLQQVVVEGTASGDLLTGPGHRRDSVLPGQEGVSVVYGRSLTYGRPFHAITELRKGDRITTVTGQGRMSFTVIGVRRAGDPIPPVAAGRARLVLATAEGARTGLTPGNAVYVDADAAKAFPAPAGRPAAVPEAEKVMAPDYGALPLLALCLALLVAMTLGVIAARQRWSTALVWVISAPIVVALSWGTTDVVMRLLPNLI
ncbi:sortase domain-bontaining protein [Nocardioides cavernaquae]|uniref:Class E sortase n=1 Tax=Nocardioides cavernaquae TaxID=2321396 RepID=A0A3A5H3G7_9ACTN|nr:sortase [Nocardioides cavernaquae]RJS45306.1 class E sortase [Nocardioides cavernaquae]